MKASQRIANRYQVKGAPALIFVDPDGQEITRGSVGTGKPVADLLKTAAGKYAPKPAPWQTDLRSAIAGKKLLVVGFDDAEGDALKVFDEPALAKYQDRLGFLRLPYEKGSETAKSWKVYRAPTILLCDPDAEDPARRPLQKLQGKKSLASVRIAVLKSLARLEARKK